MLLRTVDLFSGIGGMSLGFQKAGFEIVSAYENWESAAQTYERNFSHPVIRLDLSNVELASNSILSYRPDVIIGGPPCQDFSHAGKRIESNRATLTEDFARIISIVRPFMFVMENVDRARTSVSFKRAELIFKESGYGLSQIVLDASLCGVPQKRKRFFCIGIIDSKDDGLTPALLEGLTSKPMTVRDYLGESLGVEFYYRHPRNYSRRGIFSINEPAPTIRGVNRPLPKGYPGHQNDAAPVTDKIRALTTAERSLIQTFPREFKIISTKTDAEQMIGNAVPVELAYYVASKIGEYL